jgi:hypothetical protein
MDQMEKDLWRRRVASIGIGLILLGTAYFDPFLIGTLERIIMGFIGLSIMIMF